MGSLVERSCCGGGWCTSWGQNEALRAHYPPRHSDYRDHTPEPLSEVYKLYEPLVQEGRWTEGLLEMWYWKNKPVKASVHIPCWDSFKWDPRKWRGPCFGRTFEECYWTGLRQTRWSRAVYAANLGREYVMPFQGVGKHGYKSEIKALCWMYWLMSCFFGCGIGQLATCCGSFLIINFGAWYSCHARERLRRRYGLPPTFCLPPGIDDCLVHFFCFYCASHQELRELAVRGIDGPGMHILDVLPNSFPDAPGIEDAKAERRKIVEGMLALPPKMFRARKRAAKQEEGGGVTGMRERLAEAAVALATAREDEKGADVPAPEDAGSEAEVSSLAASEPDSELGAGWKQYCPPSQQEMSRLPGSRGAAAQPAAPAAPAQQQPGQLPVVSVRQLPSSRPQAAFSRGRSHQDLRQQSEQRMVPVVVEDGGGAEERPQLRRWSVAY